MIEPTNALILSRLVIFTAILMVWGAAAFRWGFLPDARRLDYEPMLIALLIPAILMFLPAHAGRITGGWERAFDPQILATVIRVTSPGQSWLWLAAAGSSFVLSWLLRWNRGVLVAGLGLMLGLSMTGHAAGTEGWPGWLRQSNDVLHLAASAAWLGALPHVTSLLTRLHMPGTGTVLMRYSRAGHVWVALTLITGLIATLWVFGGVPGDLSIRYQLLWWAKVAVTGAMVALALVNRYLIVPRLKAEPDVLPRIARNTLAGIWLGILAVALVAWFGTLEPR